MGVARVTEALGHDAEPLGSANAVLDGNAEAAQATVVFLLLRAQFAVSIRRRPRGSMWVQDLVGGDGVEGGVQ